MSEKLTCKVEAAKVNAAGDIGMVSDIPKDLGMQG